MFCARSGSNITDCHDLLSNFSFTRVPRIFWGMWAVVTKHCPRVSTVAIRMKIELDSFEF